MALRIKLIKNTWLPTDLFDHGWGNGYVMLPSDHPCYGMDYADINSKYDIQVNGGLTYSQQEGDFWVIGFDTAHAFNTSANWDVKRVADETDQLADQLDAIYGE